MRKIPVLCLLFCLSALVARSQGDDRCGHLQVMENMKQNHPEHYGSDEEFEHWMQTQIVATAATRANMAVVTIPVVVHVIHNGDAVGSNENISDAQVLSQIDVLNQDFRRMAGTPGFNNDPVGADTEIEFCMAEIDPNGNPTNGIDRVNMGQASWGSIGAIDGTLKPQTSWDPNSYMNVWVVNFGGGGLLGYAQFPSNSGLSGLNANEGGGDTDGVVIGYNYFGTTDHPQGNSFALSAPFDKGRTTTHEVGHWLGLRHIWGDGGCSVDDFCNDTPTSDASNTGCSTNHVSCGTVDMVQNYMDYSNDACMNIFTQDQKTRMTTVMAVATRRASLLNSTVCNIQPQAPDAAMTASQTSGCGPLAVDFADNSSFSPTSWSWSFPGGTPASSTSQNPPSVTYSAPGTYTATLTATNELGSDVTTTTIEVVDCANLVCNTLDHLVGNTPSLIQNPDGGGYISGHNDYGDIAKAEYFDDYGTAVYLTTADFDFGLASGNGNLEFAVWADNGGQPGTEIANASVAISSIAADVAANTLTTVDFGLVDITGPFYVGFKLNTSDGSNIAINTNADGDTNPSTAWEQWADGSWWPYNDYTGSNNTWEIDVAHAIYPDVCEVSSVPVAPTAGISTNVLSNNCDGAQVQFADASSGGPSSWQWDFPGGSPASYTGQTPPTITYATGGTYTITLTVTNPQGTDVTTSMIDVLDCSNFSCNTLDHLVGNTPGLIQNPDGGGYISGHNDYGDIAKAEYFDDYGAATYLTSADFDFGLAAGSGNLEFAVWADNGGQPGAEIATASVAISSIAADVAADALTTVDFGLVDITGPFYVGFKLNTSDGSNIAINTNADGDTNPSTAWEQWADGSWWPYNDYTGSNSTWEIDVAHAIYPTVCEENAVPVAPTAAFNYNIISESCESVQVQYTDMSTNNPTSWSWSFPGGSPASSTDQNPVVTYSGAGSYDAQLTATNDVGSDMQMQSGLITVPPGISANASASTTNVDLSVNPTVDFSDNSAGATSWDWDFGDGNTSTQQNPSHPYSADGTYTVTLTVSDGLCEDTQTFTITVTGESMVVAPVADFSYNVTAEACESMQVQFTDMSANNPTSWMWSFPGGNPTTSSAPNPVVDYSTPGTYDVELTVTNSAGTGSATQTGIIVVSAAISADASASATLVDVGPSGTEATVDFTDNTAGATSWAWDFGDGNISTQQNPSYTYSEAGIYTVTLTVSDGLCEDTQTFTIEVTNTTGLEDIKGLTGLGLRPNPTSDAFLLEMATEGGMDISVDIFDTVGRRVMDGGEFRVNGSLTKRYDTSRLAPGTYFVRVKSGTDTAILKLLKI